MKKLILLAALAGGGFWVYRHYFYVSPSAKVYAEFADAVGRGRYDLATKLASGAVAGQVERLVNDQNRRVGPDLSKIYGGAASGAQPTAGQLTAEIAGPVVKTRQKVLRETKDKNGTVHLAAVSSICRERPGCTGARCVTCVDYPQEVDVCSDGASRSICAFSQGEATPR